MSILQSNFFVEKDSKGQQQTLAHLWSVLYITSVLMNTGQIYLLVKGEGALGGIFAIISYGASRFFARIFLLHRPRQTMNFALSLILQIPVMPSYLAF